MKPQTLKFSICSTVTIPSRPRQQFNRAFPCLLLKLILEAVLIAASPLTNFYFGWKPEIVGAYLAALGLLMLPANLVVAALARVYDDREIIIGLLGVVVLGCLMILRYNGHYSAWQYLGGSVVLFISLNALEGLLSKTIPKSWSKGVFYVGLLATEAGTLGRSVETFS